MEVMTMTGKKKVKQERMSVPDRLRKAFSAAVADLQPQGRLPKGMTAEKAARAVDAFSALQLERFATAGEGMLAILSESDDEWSDDVDGDDAGQVSTPPETPAQVELPGAMFPPGSTPEQVVGMLRDQDLETCRRFAIVMLRELADSLRGGLDFARDLEVEEVGAVSLLSEFFDKSRRPTLTKPDGDVVTVPMSDAVVENNKPEGG